MVQLEDSNLKTITDASGSFQLENIPVGTHAILLSLENHQSNELRGLSSNPKKLIPGSIASTLLSQGTSWAPFCVKGEVIIRASMSCWAVRADCP